MKFYQLIGRYFSSLFKIYRDSSPLVSERVKRVTGLAKTTDPEDDILLKELIKKYIK